jgi:superfamily II DNA or RNA helicase/HKD family nuclease/SOS-response transcriptional repressor LexA
MEGIAEKHLTVGGKDDPFLPELLDEINSATEIAIAAAFIRLTGLNLIKAALSDALKRNVKLRILTGDYLNITDPHALRHLMLLKEQGADVRVFESEGKQSFHMKAYLFIRNELNTADDGCIYIGSSNISRSALQDGLEWNLKVNRTENEGRFKQVIQQFDELFINPRCKRLTYAWIDTYIKRIPAKEVQVALAPDAIEEEVVPSANIVQLEALAALAQARSEGYKRGLVVMATGLGKTWLAAFDSEAVGAQRVLFIAHRAEILGQAESTFMQIRPTAKVGRYNGKKRQRDVNMLFASILTLGREQHLSSFAQDEFDYIVVDEFHHAAAQTYLKLLAYFKPKFMLGLTATPERTDQTDILSLCDDKLVYSKGLFEGIEAKILCPFEYYGIGDKHVDYQSIKHNGKKFDKTQLSYKLATTTRAAHNFEQWQKYKQERTLAFCVTTEHADFMADFFIAKGVKAVAVHSKSKVQRNAALDSLRDGKVAIVFSVDLFNEGVDLPAIDTILMLRPTESKIIFLQQLGRGLRSSISTNKTKLIVLDFIGNHISFFRKAEVLFNIAVTNNARRDFIVSAGNQTLDLPSGCFVNYDVEAIDFMQRLIAINQDLQSEIYDGLRTSLGRRPTLAEFFHGSGKLAKVRTEYGQWLKMVEAKGDLTAAEVTCLTTHGDFFRVLETMTLDNGFKLVLLEALLAMDGFVSEPELTTLAQQSWDVLQRRRALLADLKAPFLGLADLPATHQPQWLAYWQDAVIDEWLGKMGEPQRAFFVSEKQRLVFKPKVATQLVDAFTLLLQELLNYCYLRYESKLAGGKGDEQRKVIPQVDLQEIPYFADLSIACGHFASSAHNEAEIQTKLLPMSYGKLNPAKHFIARSSGHSMDGGRDPIKDNDLLLLELISSDNAGSNDGKIIAIERQDMAGDDQYLLRKVKKLAQNQYQLIAHNEDYEPMMSDQAMNTFARFKCLVDPLDFCLHQSVFREDIAPLFGHEFNPGSWNLGYVSPKELNEQFLLVTLNKQGHSDAFRYHDYFEDSGNFSWHSQNSTKVDSKKGRDIINHAANNSRVHLFVRKNKLEGGKAAPLIYCGTVQYIKHEGEKPMTVKWALDVPLGAELLSYFGG